MVNYLPTEKNDSSVTEIESIDKLCRVFSQVGELPEIIASADTEQVLSTLSGMFETLHRDLNEKIVVLGEIAAYQARLLEYNGYYISFLLGTLTEEDFRDYSTKFAIERNGKYDEEELARKILTLRSTVEIDFSTSELADLFECDEERIERVCEKIDSKIVDGNSI